MDRWGFGLGDDMRRVLITSLALGLCAAPALGQQAAPAEPFGWPGLTVGMSLDQARAVIERQGYPLASDARAAGDASHRAYLYEFIDPASKVGRHLQLGSTAPNGGRPVLYVGLITTFPTAEAATAAFADLQRQAGDVYTKGLDQAEGGKVTSDFCVSRRVVYRLVKQDATLGVSINADAETMPECRALPAVSRQNALLFAALPNRPNTAAELAAAAEAARRAAAAQAEAKALAQAQARAQADAQARAQGEAQARVQYDRAKKCYAASTYILEEERGPATYQRTLDLAQADALKLGAQLGLSGAQVLENLNGYYAAMHDEYLLADNAVSDGPLLGGILTDATECGRGKYR